MVLPTLVFVLWAYGMYALVATISGRKGGNLRAHSPWRRFGWLGLGAGAAVGLGLAIVLAHSPDQEHQSLKLTGFLGTVWAEGWPDKMAGRVEYPPIKSPASGDRPVYALLHPGTPPAQLAREKTAPRPRPARKPKVHKPPVHQGKMAKAAAPVAKKDKVAAKSKSKTVKKKKPSASAAGKKNPSG